MRHDDLLTQLARHLWEIGAVMDKARSPESKGFRLKLHETNPDAPLSPVYVNLRLLRSFHEARGLAVEAFWHSAVELEFDAVADVPTAATPLVAIMADRYKLSMITPRETKKHGLPGNIDGVWWPDQSVLVIDDLITKADSKLEAIKTLEAAGLDVRDVLVLIDRQQGGREELERQGYNLHSVFTISQLLGFYREQGLLSLAMYDEISAYLSVDQQKPQTNRAHAESTLESGWAEGSL